MVMKVVVIFIIFIPFHVYHQIVGLRGCIVILVAFVWPFTAVRFPMSLKLFA